MCFSNTSKKYFLFGFFIALCSLSQAQKSRIDSLQKKLIIASSDNQQMEILNQIATSYYSFNVDSAVFYKKRALAFAFSLKEIRTQANLLTDIAAIFDRWNFPDSAMKYYLKSLKIGEKNSLQKNNAVVLNGIANIYLDQQNFDKALQYYQQSLEISKQIKDTIYLANALTGIGNVHYQKNEDVAANAYFLQALTIYQQAKNDYGISTLLGNLGSVCNDLKRYDDALDYYQRSLAMYEKQNNAEGITSCTLNIGNVYEGKGDYNQALNYDTLGLEKARKMRSSDLILGALDFIAEAYKGLGEMKKAYSYMQKYAAYKDTVMQISSTQSIADMQTKYETDKKQKANELLVQKIKIAELAEQQKKYFLYTAVAGCIILLFIVFIVFNRYRLKQKANEELEIAYQEIDTKNKIVEEKNKDITDSIYYARRIQRALLTSEKYLKKNLPDYFILYQPKDIVSGDFHWALNTQNNFFMATADCTGHGVPGAFMSMLGINFLNEIVVEKKILEPNKIMNELRQNIIHALNPEDTQEESKDGMDIVLCAFDFNNNKLKLAAANNPVWIVRKVENAESFLEEIKPDKFPVGKHDQDKTSFTAHEVTLQKGDIVYTFTDGYADQFGGPKGKKFKYKQLQELLLANCDKPMNEQQKIITETLVNWKGNLEQVDDILLIGIRV